MAYSQTMIMCNISNNGKSEAGKTLMLQIQDEFGNDHDGYGLWEYLKAWATAA